MLHQCDVVNGCRDACNMPNAWPADLLLLTDLSLVAVVSTMSGCSLYA